VRFCLIAFAIWLLVSCGLATAVHLNTQQPTPESADAIVVLGAGLRRDNQAGPALTRRSQRAAELYAQGTAPYIICTGGMTGGRIRSEADACREVLMANGVPADVIVLEEQSRSTEENALYVHEIMLAQGWQNAVVVSDGFHLLRAGWIFELEDVEAQLYPAATRPRLATYLTAVMREVIALQWQLLKELLGLDISHIPVL
jgi:uncharacterized SAM-binding protein YcdF (DUF218 family)